MEHSGVVVRSATQEDADFLAWVLLEASRSSLPRGFYDVLFGDPSEEEMLALLKDLTLSTEATFTRWDSFVIAEVDGTPAGGRPPSDFRNLFMSYSCVGACGYAAAEKTGEGLWRAVVNALKKRNWSVEQLATMERAWNELLVLWPPLNGTPHPAPRCSGSRVLNTGYRR
jgi:hypothetical protein